ncbi:MAG: hypothetical protein PVG11_04055, partial [Anaerolineae bacterium]
GVVYLYYFHQFDRPVVVDVAQELADPRPPGPLSQLFPADVQEEAARRHQHILAGADRCQQTGVAWVILVLICLVLLIVLSARSRRGWALWVPAVVVLGPLGLLAWLLAGRRREPAGWRAAVVEATGDVIPTAMAFVAALVVLVLVPAVLASQPLQLVLMLGVPPVAGWLFFQAPALALATGKGYLRTLRQRLPQALVAAGLGLGGIVAVSLPLVNRIANTCGVLPLHAGTVATWWAIVIPGALAGGLLLFLYELWAVRRGYHAWRVLAWGEGQVHSPPWRTVWWWILLSCVILLGGLVVGAAL